MRVTMLVTELEGQRNLGAFVLRDGRVAIEGADADGFLVLREILGESLLGEQDRPVTSNQPEAWLRALPWNYNGSRLRAELSEV